MTATPGLRYIPALDGVRALAVAAVLAYHGGLRRAAGGFLGVDIFFVLSGFLITSLLLAEHEGSGHIRLPRFWARRARRLLPALLAMLAAVAGYAVWLAPPDTLAGLRRAALATLLYVANWAQMRGGQGYFAQLAAPSPLLHTWSLAIEEQFYALWPLLVVGLLWMGRVALPPGRARRIPLLAFALMGAAGSAAAMDLLYRGGSGINRVYYGTDTRAQDLLIGAALAVVLSWVGSRGGARADRPDGPVRRAVAGAVGTAAVATLGVAVTTASGASAWLYRGGFAGMALAAAALLATLVLVPGGGWDRVFSLAPLRYLGRISYGLYLWHWPLFLILDGSRTGLSGWPLFGLRSGASVALAAASYHGLEMPIRTRRARPWALRAAWPAAVGGVAGALVLATVAPAGAEAAPGVQPPPARASVPAGTASLLPAVPAGSGGPVRVLLLGDSMGWSLVRGLGPGSLGYGVDLQSDAVIGCGLVTSGLVTNRGISAPETEGLRAGARWVRCSTWPQRWAKDVARFHPDVVALLAGPWEVRNRLLDGHWVHIGQPGFDRLERSAIERAVQVMGSAGAQVALLTCPYLSQPEQADGRAQPDDAPARMDDYNDMLRQAARAQPGRVDVVDLGARLSPDNRYASRIDGVDVRDADGIHVSPAGGRWLQPWLLPVLRSMAAHARGRATPGE